VPSASERIPDEILAQRCHPFCKASALDYWPTTKHNRFDIGSLPKRFDE
jgi:hypothetical protein